ncbi:hypothetical protein [Sinorhizobium fredii]|uniref:hypothetical protein n=1 Tax=Rhizobium fredii TaxID=380 RepID=UPI0035196797
MSGHVISGDETRQAIDALRGYAYQIYASAIAWLQITDDEVLHLEVAEDFAISSEAALIATQSKATARTITINDAGVAAVIDSFFLLSKANPDRSVTIRFLTTSQIAPERDLADRIDGESALLYWRKAAVIADIAPIRERLGRLKLKPGTRAAIESLSDADFREKFLKRIIWDTDNPALEDLLARLRDTLLQVGSDRGISPLAMAKCVGPIIAKVLTSCTDPSQRSLTARDLTVLIEECTSISVPIDQHLQQQRLIQTLLATQGLRSDASILPTRSRDVFKPISTGAAFASLAVRNGLQDAVVNRLSANLVAWLHAGTGFGKTTLARFAAGRIGGTWKALNVRGIDRREIPELLYPAGQALSGSRYTGIILDDIEHFERSEVAEALRYFFESAAASSCLVVASSYNKPSEAALSAFGVSSNITLHVPELNETDVRQVVQALGGEPDLWGRYVYLASGSGHPQLVQALSRNLSNREWPFEELENLNALLGGNTEIAKVREETRRRLVASLRPEELDLLTRLTLVPGKFDRPIVLQIGEGDPRILNAGLAFDSLVGPWVDETYEGVYQVSPLISDLAVKTISEATRLRWQRHIAIALTSGKSLDAGKMNAAVLMALATEEHSVLMKIAMATIRLDGEELSNLGVTFFALQAMRVDRPISEADPYLNVLLRLTQYLLLAHEPERDNAKIQQVWEKLQLETKLVETRERSEVLELMVLSKAIWVSGARGQLPNIVDHLYRVYEITRSLPYDDIRKAYTVRKDGHETTGLAIMFLMQAQSFEHIADTLEAFEAINRLPKEFRKDVFAALEINEMDADMYFSGPWLKEHTNNTIEPLRHAQMYEQIAAMTLSWGYKDLAIAATKYQAIVLDEYGNSPNEALDTLESARKWAGSQNWELLRAEAKILYRAKRYHDALPLYAQLAAGGSTSAVEGAFMLREAGICAAETENWPLAARYYGDARDSALQSEVRSMFIMATGLLGDEAVANWHAGNRKVFIGLARQGLLELAGIKIDESLTARHCHAMYRHTLLWAQDQLAGDVIIRDGSKPQMISGAVSNPEPSPTITAQPIGSLELAWYMLAAIEIQCDLDPSISDELDTILGGKKLLSGESWLSGFTLQYYQRTFSIAGIVATAREIATTGIIARSAGQGNQKPNLENPDYIEIRRLTEDENRASFGVFEMLIASSAVVLLVNGRCEEIQALCRLIAENHGDHVSDSFAMAVASKSDGTGDFASTIVGKILEIASLAPSERLHPNSLAHLQLLILQLIPVGTLPSFARVPLMYWMKKQWSEAISTQGFLLKTPGPFGRQLNNLHLDEKRPLASSAKIVALAIDHVSVPISEEFRSMVADISARQD